MSIKDEVLYSIAAELDFARAKFPANDDLMSALTEEVGELAKALLHHKHEKGPAKDVFAEAIQVAVMAIRIAEEGSKEFPYKYDREHYVKFDSTKLWRLVVENNKRKGLKVKVGR